MEVISKNKPKGKAYSKIKAKRKRTNLQKAIKQRTENKRINLETEKQILNTEENMDRVSGAFRLLNWKKNYLIIDIDGEIEKRAIFDKEK